jgi:mannose/fructose/N-acetylgalactosamine-specific phosphotransferase system component IID
MIVGRYGLVLVVAVLTVAATIATVAVLATQGAPSKPVPMALAIAVVQLLGTFATVALNWKQGWWFILERGAPKLILVGAGAQVVALFVAGLWRPRGRD